MDTVEDAILIAAEQGNSRASRSQQSLQQRNYNDTVITTSGGRLATLTGDEHTLSKRWFRNSGNNNEGNNNRYNSNNGSNSVDKVRHEIAQAAGDDSIRFTSPTAVSPSRTEVSTPYGSPERIHERDDDDDDDDSNDGNGMEMQMYGNAFSGYRVRVAGDDKSSNGRDDLSSLSAGTSSIEGISETEYDDDDDQGSLPATARSVVDDVDGGGNDGASVVSTSTTSSSVNWRRRNRKSKFATIVDAAAVRNAEISRMMYEALAALQWQRNQQEWIAQHAPVEAKVEEIATIDDVQAVPVDDSDDSKLGAAGGKTGQQRGVFSILMGRSLPEPASSDRGDYTSRTDDDEIGDGSGSVGSSQQQRRGINNSNSKPFWVKYMSVATLCLCALAACVLIVAIVLGGSNKSNDANSNISGSTSTSNGDATQPNEGGGGGVGGGNDGVVLSPTLGPATLMSPPTAAPSALRDGGGGVNTITTLAPTPGHEPPITVPTTPWPSTAAPTAGPVPVASTPEPKPSGPTCFTSNEELMIAVDAYLENNRTDSAVAQMYGWPISTWCVSAVTDMSDLFSATRNPAAEYFTEDLSGWDTSSVQFMNKMFRDASSFNGYIGNWNTSSLEEMEFMFSAASSFNQDLNMWDTSKVVSTANTFRMARAFNGDISAWNMSSNKNMQAMFYSASAFNRPLANWDTHGVITFNSMFEAAVKFDQDISQWDVSRALRAASMFANAISFNQNITAWSLSRATDVDQMFAGATSFNQDVSGWYMQRVRSANGMFSGAAAFSQDLCKWGTWWDSSIQSTGLFEETACPMLDDPVVIDSTTGTNLRVPGPFCYRCQ